MITGVQDTKATIEAVRRGAFDYIRKPLDLDAVLLALRPGACLAVNLFLQGPRVGQFEFEACAEGVQFVGLAIDEKDAVETFTDTYGVDYPILLADMAAIDLSRRLGNRFNGLPYTLVVAPGGRIVARHFGGMKREQIEPLLMRLSAHK